jgi:hypothetical protein
MSPITFLTIYLTKTKIVNLDIFIDSIKNIDLFQLNYILKIKKLGKNNLNIKKKGFYNYIDYLIIAY